MKIVTRAQFVPGVCLICGGSDSDRAWFLDIEKQAEFWGNIYFCNLCCGTMVYLFRCGDVSAHRDRIAELEETGCELLERAEIYESALSTLRSLPDHNSVELASILAHKELGQPEPEIGISEEPAGLRFTKSSNDEGVDKLPGSEFVTVQPHTDTGW